MIGKLFSPCNAQKQRAWLRASWVAVWLVCSGMADAWAQAYEDRPLPPIVARTNAELYAAQRDPSPAFVASQYALIKRRASDFVVAQRALLFAKADSVQVIDTLRAGAKLHQLREHGAWSVVRTIDRRVGYVATESLSNVWVLVSKSKHTTYVYKGVELIAQFPSDFAINVRGDKIQRGSTDQPEHWRTPEGLFYISRRNPNSQFYKALVLNYPAPHHAEAGLKSGIIDRRQYADIVKAAMMFESPPMNTPLGGWIEFHGWGVEGKANWTHGCIALEDKDIDQLWTLVDVGTPVLIRPYKPGLYDHEPTHVEPRPLVPKTRAVPSEKLRVISR